MATLQEQGLQNTGAAGRSGARPTLGELIASESKALRVLAGRGQNDSAFDGVMIRLCAYQSLAVQFGMDMKLHNVPAKKYGAALKAAKEVAA